MSEEKQGQILYEKVLKEAQADENILGFFLTAGRGKGMVTDKSDYDAFMIVRDEKIGEYRKKYEQQRIYEVFDLILFSFSEFKNYAAIGSDTEADRYNFTHIQAQIDRVGIQGLIDEKGRMPEEKIREIVEKNLDDYINSYYRSLKNNRDEKFLASQLDGTESIPSFLTALFAMNGRVRPYNKYLSWELTSFGENRMECARIDRNYKKYYFFRWY